MSDLSEKIPANTLKGQLLNPLRALFPLLVLIILDIFFSPPIGFVAAVFTAIAMLIYNIRSGVHGFQRILATQTFVLLLAGYVSFFIKTTIFRHIYTDALVVFVLLLLYLLKSWLINFFVAKHPQDEIFIHRSFTQFYFVSKIVAFIAISRIVFFIAFNSVIPSVPWVETVFNTLFLLALFLVVFIETFKLSFFRKKLSEEEFLPVVDQCGAVVGKMVKSEMGISAEKQLHPIVRMYFINDDSIFLQKENFCDPRSTDYWDASADTHVNYGESMEDAIRRSVRCMCYSSDISPKFLLKYVYKTDKEEHLVFLYYVQDAAQIEMAQQTDFFGKFWPLWQIESNLGQGVFSPQFEMEYAYFKNTVFVGKR